MRVRALVPLLTRDAAGCGRQRCKPLEGNRIIAVATMAETPLPEADERGVYGAHLSEFALDHRVVEVREPTGNCLIGDIRDLAGKLPIWVLGHVRKLFAGMRNVPFLLTEKAASQCLHLLAP